MASKMRSAPHRLVVLLVLAVMVLSSDAFPVSWTSSPVTTTNPPYQVLFAEAKIGTIFGTCSGSTEDVADVIVQAFGDAASEPINIDDVLGSLDETFASFEALVVGVPTYNTDADRMRSATNWDGAYYSEIEALGKSGHLKGKKTAVFGLGDQEGYEENFADATRELHDVFAAHGAQMFGYTDASSAAGYGHEASKTQLGDKFVGLVIDNANQPELTDERVKAWVAQLKAEGFLGESTSKSSSEVGSAVGSSVGATPAATTAAPTAAEGRGLKAWNCREGVGLPVNIKGETTANGFVSSISKTIKQTIWLSTKDHRRSYYTYEK